MKINNDLASNKKLSESERRNIELGALYNFKGVSNVTEPGIYAGAGVPLGKNAFPDVDKVIAETKAVLHARAEYNRQNARPSLQDLIDEERARKEEPIVVPERKPSPGEVHAESRSILQTTENLRKMETQEMMEKVDKQLAESENLLQTLGHRKEHGPGTLQELEQHLAREERSEQEKAFQKAIRQITSG